MIYIFFIGMILGSLYLLCIFIFQSQFSSLQHVEKVQKKLYDFFYTIIIPARNEAHNIGNLLQDLVSQQFSSTMFEVIVMDDDSTDATVKTVEKFAKNGVKIISILDKEQLHARKKLLISKGIAQAKGDYIITLDADVRIGDNWLSTIDKFISNKFRVAAIAAPVLMQGENNWLSIFQEIDFGTMQGITAVVVNKQWFAMCNGANFIYKKDAFHKVNGFEGVDEYASGDDMFLMQKIMKQYPNETYYLLDDNALAVTQTEPTIAAFLQQRIRWASKARGYTSISLQLTLLLVLLFNIWLIITPIIALIFLNKTLVYSWMVFLLSKVLVEFLLIKKVFIFFKKKVSFIKFLLLQPIHIAYIVLSAFLGFFKKYEWKGRVVK